MSSNYTPKNRNSAMLGCNIRPGQIPGGFVHSFGASRNHNRSHASVKSRETYEAAMRVLEGRGIINEPTTNDSTARAPFQAKE